jgi:hypothetical protein
MDANKRNELLEFLIELRDDKAELENRLKGLNGEIDGIEQELIEDMLQSEDASFNHKGVTCSLVRREFVSPEALRKDDLWAAMRVRGFEHLFTINSQTLSGTIKELKLNNDDQLPEWLDGLVKITEKPSIRLMKGHRAGAGK